MTEFFTYLVPHLVPNDLTRFQVSLGATQQVLGGLESRELEVIIMGISGAHLSTSYHHHPLIIPLHSLKLTAKAPESMAIPTGN